MNKNLNLIKESKKNGIDGDSMQENGKKAYIFDTRHRR
jgi:hypothetical protein